MRWLKKLMKSKQREHPAISVPHSTKKSANIDSGQAYIDRVHQKIDRLVADLADGRINRSQFQELYSHYQREIRNIETVLLSEPDEWQDAASEGQSLLIRKQYMARAQAYAIYENESGLPLGTLGKFKLDPTLVIPMLSSYRSATAEIFGAGMRSTQIESGQWLCFVPGEFSTLLAVFSNEPISKQLEYLDKLHQHFEGANRRFLTEKPIDTSELIYPHEFFLGTWRK